MGLDFLTVQEDFIIQYSTQRSRTLLRTVLLRTRRMLDVREDPDWQS